MPLRVTWSPVRIDGTHGPRVYSTFAEWAASGGRLPVVFGKQSGAWVAFRPILENGRLGDVVWQDRKEYVTSRGGILEYTGKLDELERTPLPSLHPLPKEITDPTPADEVRRKIHAFG